MSAEIDLALIAALESVSTNSLATVLLKKNIRNVWIRGPRPLGGGIRRAVGPAFTLRFIPSRADISGRTTRDAVEEMPAGAMVVADARGLTDVGTFGDIVVTRMAMRGLAGIVTDGAVRDSAGLLATGLPIWSNGLAPSPPIAGHNLAGWQEPISCGGVAVFPGDIIVADAEGAIVVPAKLVAEAAKLGTLLEQEDENYLAGVRAGKTLTELYKS